MKTILLPPLPITHPHLDPLLAIGTLFLEPKTIGLVPLPDQVSTLVKPPISQGMEGLHPMALIGAKVESNLNLGPQGVKTALPSKQTGWSPSRPTSATRQYDNTRSGESRPRTPSNPPQVNIPPQSGLRTEVPEICRRCSPGITCANRCKDPPDNNFCAKCLNKGHPDHGCPYYFAIGSCVHCPKHAHITKECQWVRHPERFPAALKREEHAPKDKKLQKANF